MLLHPLGHLSVRLAPCGCSPGRTLFAALAFLQLLRPGLAHTQEIPAPRSDAAEPAAEVKVGKQLRALRITGAAPQIDGRLNEEAWRVADAIEDFVQWEPENMAALSERTVVQVAYDDRYLYVAVSCYDRDPSGITAGLGRRDTHPATDWIEVGFDPQHDHLTAYVYEANPSGVQGDLEFFDDTRTNRDYDAVWEVATQLTGDGWVAEFRIPFSQMRFVVPPAGEAAWGFSVRRTIYRKGEFGEWTGRPRGEQGNVSRWGHLIFADRLVPPRRIELLPFSLARREDVAGEGVGHAVSGGIDARVGLGTSATLSATINPDFGQVEQDPAVLNLTVFETVRAIRADASDARIIVLTVRDDDEAIYRALDAGAAAYLLKDTLSDDLIHVIREVHAGQRPPDPS